jgi:hypothetical protein
MQFSSVDDALRSSQRQFWALELGPGADESASGPQPVVTMRESRFDLAAAEQDRTLDALASTYSAENQSISDGLARPGVRLVTFAPVLKHGVFPLAETLTDLLELGSRGLNRAAEIEFAVRLSRDVRAPHEFGFLQMRPLVMARETADLVIEDVPADDLLCRSPRVMGHGLVADLRDVVVVDFHHFDRSKSRAVADAVARFNAVLADDNRPYLLIGVGRWGSTDPWLGIPVTWDQISGARVIIESGFRDMRVTPSQGSHFFQNLTSFQVGYFTVNAEDGEGFVDWDWIGSQPAEGELDLVRHLRTEEPLIVKMNGRRNQGIIYKPGRAPKPE